MQGACVSRALAAPAAACRAVQPTRSQSLRAANVPQLRAAGVPAGAGRPARRCSGTVVAAAAGGAAAVAPGNATEQLADAWERLRGTQVFLVSTQQPVDITSLWGEGERAVVAFGRHMGCAEGRRDVGRLRLAAPLVLCVWG